MDDKKAAETLLKMLQKYSLGKDEKEAVGIAVGILSWTSLSKNRLKAIKEKKDEKIKKALDDSK